MSTYSPGPVRGAAKAALIRMRREAEAKGDTETARHLRQAKICMELAHKLYRDGWYNQ